MNHFLIVFLGGGIGAALRHAVNRLAFHIWPAFPAGTMIVNICGSLAMGLLVGIFAATPSLSQHTRLFLATGVLGGFTTFSTFSLDALTLGRGARTAPGFSMSGFQSCFRCSRQLRDFSSRAISSRSAAGGSYRENRARDRASVRSSP